jgi:hypothetical protein
MYVSKGGKNHCVYIYLCLDQFQNIHKKKHVYISIFPASFNLLEVENERIDEWLVALQDENGCWHSETKRGPVQLASDY